MTLGKETILIEFAGPPGSGKSTILNAFCDEYRTQLPIIPIYSDVDHDADASAPIRAIRKGLAIAEFAITQPGAAFHTIQFVRRSSGLSRVTLKHLLRCWSFAVRMKRMKKQSAAGSILLADQGFVQFMGSLSIPAKDANAPDVDAALISVLHVDRIVNVDCSEETAELRRTDRTHGKSRFDSPSTDGQNRDVQRFTEVVDASIAIARSSGVPILTLDADEPVPVNIARLAAWLQMPSDEP